MYKEIVVVLYWIRSAAPPAAKSLIYNLFSVLIGLNLDALQTQRLALPQRMLNDVQNLLSTGSDINLANSEGSSLVCCHIERQCLFQTNWVVTICCYICFVIWMITMARSNSRHLMLILVHFQYSRTFVCFLASLCNLHVCAPVFPFIHLGYTKMHRLY